MFEGVEFFERLILILVAAIFLIKKCYSGFD